MKTRCSIPGCEQETWARGWCAKHYQAWRKRGDPCWNRSEREDRAFWERVEKSPDGCWRYTGYVTEGGYGTFRRGGSAHRFALASALGRPLGPGMMALHTCDVRNCVRNDDEGWYEINGVLRPRRGHLWEGTSAENTADRHAKGRDAEINGAVLHPDRLSRGEDRYNAKLTEAQVILIRSLFADGVKRDALAERFGVGQSNIDKIVYRKAWKHV